MSNESTSSLSALGDPELVAASLSGDRSAFGQIVTRYQTLICSIAYNGTGNVRRSEDLAQETFIVAWRDLRQLRDPDRLRSWLCGIVRHRVSHGYERGRREPSHDAQPLEAAREFAAPEPTPSDEAVTREEQAILWRALEEIPEVYREPLILFYREHQSIEHVAVELDLTEEAVRQRLSRGRKLLQEQVTAFVSGALARTAPTEAFTTAVLGALPVLAVPTVTATAALTQGGALLKAIGTGALVSAIAGPVLGLLSGWLGFRISIENAESERERRYLRQMAWRIVLLTVLSLVAIGVMVYAAVTGADGYRAPVVVASIAIEATAGLALAWIVLRANRELSAIRRDEAATLAVGAAQPLASACSQASGYRSRLTLFGLPLLHVRFEPASAGRPRPAVGWIAIGNVAYGGLVAFGGVAIAPISFGAAAVGGLAFGAVGLGLWSVAAFAAGWCAIGGVAVGYVAEGGAAFGWLVSVGGVSVAHDFAVGAVAFAAHVNDAVARHVVQVHPLCRALTWTARHVGLLVLPPFGLVVWQMLSQRRRSKSG